MKIAADGDGMSDEYEYVVHIGYPKDGAPAMHIAINVPPILQRSHGDPGVFGFMAAQLVEHCANAVEGLILLDEEPLSRDQILERIKEELLIALGEPVLARKEKTVQ